MTDDIVTRLREEGFITHMARLSRESKILHAAADEIERLRATNVELEVRIKSIKEGFEGCCTACEPVGEINKKLREERDEARREVCELRTDIGFNRPIASHLVEFAASRGWDCFKEARDER